MAQVLPIFRRAQPWKPADATDGIRRLARCEDMTLTYREHARDQMIERDLLMSDVLYVLKNGFIYQDAKDSTRPGFYKYRTECPTPNSNNREVGVVVCPDPERCEIKVITVMWLDEM
ncbi:MAG: DUF4258 domain-containing protein [Pseudomonadota bacterium]